MEVTETYLVGAVHSALDDRMPTVAPRRPVHSAAAPHRSAGRRDAALGAGLVGFLPLAVVSTFWLLAPRNSGLGATLAIDFGASILAIALLGLPWTKLPPAALLVFRSSAPRFLRRRASTALWRPAMSGSSRCRSFSSDSPNRDLFLYWLYRLRSPCIGCARCM